MTKTCGAHHTLHWRPLIDWFMLGDCNKVLPQTFTSCNITSNFPIGCSYDQLQHKMVVLFLVTSQPIGIVYKSPTTFYNLWYLDLHRPSDKVTQSELILKTLFEYHYNDTGWIDRNELNPCDTLWQRVIVLPPYSTTHQTYVWPSCQPFALDP